MLPKQGIGSLSQAYQNCGEGWIPIAEIFIGAASRRLRRGSSRPKPPIFAGTCLSKFGYFSALNVRSPLLPLSNLPKPDSTWLRRSSRYHRRLLYHSRSQTRTRGSVSMSIERKHKISRSEIPGFAGGERKTKIQSFVKKD